MKNAIIASVILHLAILVLIFLDLTNPFRSKSAESPPLIIDFKAVGSQSMAKHLSPINEKKADVLQKKEMPKPTDTTPEPEVQESKEAPSPNTTPEKSTLNEPLKKEIKNKENPIEDIKQDKKLKEVNIDKKEKEPKKKKPTEKSESAKKSKKTDNSSLINLNKNKKTDKKKPVDKKTKNAEKNLDDLMDKLDDTEGSNEASAPADSIGDVLTATEIQAIKATYKKCWYVPAGTQGVLDTPVDATLHMNDDGTVREVEIEDMRRFKTDPVFRTAAESVKRAALDPKCNPLPLPKKTYSSWKTLPFNFDPKIMAGISGGIR